jgi:uncharacterized membrane protein
MTHAPATSRPGFALPLRPILLFGLGGALVAFLAWRLLAQGPAAGHPHPFSLHAPRWELLAAAPAIIRLHVAAAVFAFAAGAILLAGVKGTAVHKALGWGWMAAMMTVAVSSLFIQTLNPGHWSFIHFLSGWVIIAVPLGLAAIKRKNVKMHRRMMTSLFLGGLVIAGAFTFVPGRLMYQVFFG